MRITKFFQTNSLILALALLGCSTFPTLQGMKRLRTACSLLVTAVVGANVGAKKEESCKAKVDLTAQAQQAEERELGVLRKLEHHENNQNILAGCCPENFAHAGLNVCFCSGDDPHECVLVRRSGSGFNVNGSDGGIHFYTVEANGKIATYSCKGEIPANRAYPDKRVELEIVSAQEARGKLEKLQRKGRCGETTLSKQVRSELKSCMESTKSASETDTDADADYDQKPLL